MVRADVFPGSFAVFCGAASPRPAFSRGVPRRRWGRRRKFELFREYPAQMERASAGWPPRFARRSFGIAFSVQKRIGICGGKEFFRNSFLDT